MAISVTPINTHSVGDTLPVADWNAAANWLNGGVGYMATNGLVTNASTNNGGATGPGAAPFMIYAGAWEITSSSTGIVQITIPGGGFPNGLIAVTATSANQNSAGGSQGNHTIQPIYSGSSASTKQIVNFVAYTNSGATVNSTLVRFSAIMIGY